MLILLIAILGIVTLIATKKWLRRGWASWIVYGGAGCAMVLLMYFVDVPPVLAVRVTPIALTGLDR